MVSSRKRGWQEMADDETPTIPSTLQRLRNMWEFANLAQWIFIFGKAVKIDEQIDIEELEAACLETDSTLLPEIGLSLLKFVSSHRGLTSEIFDEYTRRQYFAKAPEKNPFGTDEEPTKFTSFNVFTQIRVLQQLTQWTLGNPDRIRERMEEQRDADQAYWRIEPFGWDADDRTYFVLDDNRLYRRTDPPPPPPPTPKAKKNKKMRAGTRASKRRRVSTSVESEAEEHDEVHEDEAEDLENTFGGMKWECVAVTLPELTDFIATIERSRDPNEKILRKRLAEDLLPILEQQEESQKRKAMQKEKELLNIAKLATAKRSSRIATKMEQQRVVEESREAERKKQADLLMAHREQERWLKLENERESRMVTREQRLREREARRILHEQELADLSESGKKLELGDGRISERHLKTRLERKKLQLEQLTEDDDWIFDCICGAYGKIDDGSHSIACETCNIWQHSKCVGIKKTDADRDDFRFICSTCRRRADDAERAKSSPIKIKLSRPGSSSSQVPSTPLKSSDLPSSSPSKPMNGHIQTTSPPVTLHVSTPAATASQADATSLLDSSFKPQLVTNDATQTPAASHATLRHGSSTINHMINTTPGHHASNGSTFASAYPAPNAFTPPAAHSPISLPPPSQSRVYATFAVNGDRPRVRQPPELAGTSALRRTESTPVDRQPVPASRPVPSEASPAKRPPTPAHPSHLSSYETSPTSHSTPSPILNKPPWTPGPLPPTPNHQIPVDHQSASDHRDLGRSSALPPSSSGVSPVKHSPPRLPSQSHTLSGTATPSVLPPVAALSPSPRLQNLTPPVKTSEPLVPRDHVPEPAR